MYTSDFWIEEEEEDVRCEAKEWRMEFFLLPPLDAIYWRAWEDVRWCATVAKRVDVVTRVR